MTEQLKKRDEWKSRIGVILAVAGSAVGLGNFLRFPGQAVQNGGGIFMIPYFISFLIVGIPICWIEWTLGRHGGQRGLHSCPGIFGLVGRSSFWRYSGIIGVIIPVIIYMYYVVIESWCLGYAIDYLTGAINLGNDPNDYASRSQRHFADFVGSNANGLTQDGNLLYSFKIWAVVFVLNFLIILRGVSGGIEKVCQIAVPLMSICAFFVLFRVLTLGTPNPAFPDRNILTGLGFMWNPKSLSGEEPWFEVLANPQVWLSAAGQVFFSLSVGFGIIVNYASYLRKNQDVLLSGLTASSTNEFFEVCLGGFITIPAAFIFLGVSGAIGGTFDLGFVTMPIVFEYMPAGRFFGFLWFFMLFLAALTSSFSMLQPAIAFLEEGIAVRRNLVVGILCAITGGGALFVQYYSKGNVALDTMDFWVGTALIFVLAMLQVILFSWVYGVDQGSDEAERNSDISLPPGFRFVVRYITPTFLIIIFVSWCINNLPDYIDKLLQGGVPLYSILVIGTVMLGCVLIIAIGRSLWDNVDEGHV